MFELDSVSLGIIFLFVGILFFVIIFVFVRLISRRDIFGKPQKMEPNFQDMAEHQDAVLVVQPGGKISFLNQVAREIFDVWQESPNLERLAKKTRPLDTFLGLCSAEGRAPFSLDGQPMEGVSYYVPNGSESSIIVSIRTQQLNSISIEDREYSDQAIEVISALGQSMQADLDLESTLDEILSGATELIPADFSELAVYDVDKQHLSPYRLIGVKGLDRRVEEAIQRYPIGEGYAGRVADQRKPLLINDVDQHREYHPLIDRQKYPFHSYLGVPLQIADRLIGTIGLTSLDKNAFTENDVEIMELLSGQAAIALQNSLLYREEKRRALELSSLANLTQAVSSVQDPNELFAHLAKGISPLLDVEIAGFLIFLESRRTLVAQNPFIGVPPQFVDLYQVEILPDSRADIIWRDQHTLVITEAGENHQMEDLGLDHLARAAGIRHTVLVPLKSGGRSLGYLQAANKRDGTPFTSDDVRLLSIVAGQAAPIIENADLIQQSIRRALRAEALRRIASLSGSEAELDEILKYSVIELSRLLKADAAAIFFLDDDLAELKVHRDSIYGVSTELFDQLGRVPVVEPYSKYIVSISKEPFFSANISLDNKIIPPYAQLIETLDVNSAIDVPLIFRGNGLGELMLASKSHEHFSESDIQLAMTVAGQLAVAVERISLASVTDADLRQRVEQLTVLTRIGRELNSSVSLKKLLKYIHDETLKTIRADCGTIALFDLDSHAGERPKVNLQIGDKVSNHLHPLEVLAVKKGVPVLIADYNNPPETLDESTLQPAHQGVHSALVIPLINQERPVGIFHFHSKQPNHFDESALQFAQALAVQAAVAVENVHRFEQQQKSNQKLSKRITTYKSVLSASEEGISDAALSQSLRNLASSICSEINSPAVFVGNLIQNELSWDVFAGFSQIDLDEKNLNPVKWAQVEKYLLPEYLSANTYVIPYEKLSAGDWPTNLLEKLPFDHKKVNNIIIHPLLNSSSDPLGMIFAISPKDESPDQTLLDIFDDYGQQVSSIINNYLHVSELEMQIHSLENELLGHESDVVRVLEEKNLSFSQERVNAVLAIIDLLSMQPDREVLLESLGYQFSTRLGMNSVLVVEMRQGGPQLLHAMGEMPETVNLQALLGQSNPTTESLNNGKLFLISDLLKNQEWSESPIIQALKGKGFICLPIIAQAGSPAAILGVSTSQLRAFSQDDEQLFRMFSAQSASALNNLNLLTDTGKRLKEVYLLLEFSRQLGGVEAIRILNLLIESAIEVVFPAQAGMIIGADLGADTMSPRVALGYTDSEKMREINFETGGGLINRVLEHKKAVSIGEFDFSQQYKLSQDDLMRYRSATGGKLPVSTHAAPIYLGKKLHSILVLDNFDDTTAFSGEDQALVASLCRQVALTLENISLYQAAEERAGQLETLSKISASMTATLEYGELVSSLLEVLESLLPYDTSSLWLRKGDSISISSARGFDNDEDLIGLETSVSDSRLFSEMVETNQAIFVGDVREDERFPEYVVERLSWLAVPMFSKGNLIGVIALEKAEAYFYDSDQIQLLTTFANQSAIALENAELYHQSLTRSEQLDQRSRRLNYINRFSNDISGSLNIEELLALTGKGLDEALPGSAISIALVFGDDLSLQFEMPRTVETIPWELPNAPLFDHLKQSLGVFNTTNVSEEETLEPLLPYFEKYSTKALLVLPLFTGNDVHGFIFVHSETEHRFTANEIELALILTNQAAVAIQNATLYSQTRQLTSELEERVEERTLQLEKEHHRAQSLLRIMQELSASLDLDHVLNRTLKLLNDITLAEQSTILLIRPNEEQFYYRASLGYTNPPPPGGRATELQIGDGLAGWIVRHREGVLIDNLTDDDRWFYSAKFKVDHRSVMGVPLLVGAELLGVMLMFHRDQSHFTPEQMEMAQASANQIAVSINNAELFNLIREQAERLGSMLRTQQVETSRSRAILEAVADGVLVTDAEINITLFNNSAQNVLGLQRADVVGKSLEGFSGLFGGAARMWLDKISALSSAPSSFNERDTFAERIVLDDGRIVSVHLAPVNLQNEFLGTVSIFRDITHQVEVDRLKSEFVATVSHELRTPMTSIKGYVEILLMGAAGELSEQQTKFLEVVLGNTERLNILVNDLLDVSRMDAGKIDLSVQSLRLLDLAESVIADQTLRSEVEEKPINFDHIFPADLPRVRGDEDRVRQILANLVSNAYHYSPANGQISIQASYSDTEVQVDIIDNGIGIHPDDQRRVFERFFRGEDPLVLATAGTGLGLSIVQQLIEMHNGRIWLESKGIPGEGSKFSFTLPIYKED